MFQLREENYKLTEENAQLREVLRPTILNTIFKTVKNVFFILIKTIFYTDNIIMAIYTKTISIF